MVSTDVDPVDWDRFVEAHADATGYHLWRWREIFTRTFGHQCEYLVARHDGHIAGVLPLVFLDTWWFGRFAISLPFVNYGGVLAGDSATADELVSAAGALARSRGLAHVELRHRQRQCAALPVKEHKVTMLLPLLHADDAMWQSLDRKVRNQIRKAEKSNLECLSGGAELLDSFYAVFSRNMRDLGVPVHSRSFFQAVLAQFGEHARVHLVRRAGLDIAGALTYRFRDVVEVPWASSLKEYLALCPNNLLYWSIIRQAIAEGARTLDFGRSTPNEGTYHFKRQWGATPQPLLSWEYLLLAARELPDQSPKNPRFKIAMNAWKRLPVSVAGLLGPSLVRGMPY